MLSKDSGIIDATLGIGTISQPANFSRIARSHYYFDIYAGSLSDYIAYYNAYGQYPAMIRVYPFSLSENTQIGQSKSLNIVMPLDYYEYNYTTGTRSTVTGAPCTAHVLGKGYLVKAYFGYASPETPTSVSVKQRFTGIIDNINPSADNNELTVNCIDFATMFMNALNKSYPDINSYRDAPADAERVQPADLYNDQLLGLFVPAYDNWLVKDALRDICIKAGFPVYSDWLKFEFNDSATMRLGRSEKYPYMKSKTIFDYVVSNSTVANMTPGRPIPSFVRDASLPATTTRVEKTIYQGIDDEQLNESKYRFDWGKTLWDCLISLCEEFGLRLFFSETGALTIKGVRQYQWESASETFNKIEAKENHVWQWSYWLVSGQAGCQTATSTNALTHARIVKGRFISLATKTDSCTIDVQIYKDGDWVIVAHDVVIPELAPYQYAEVDLYVAANSSDPVLWDTGNSEIGSYSWAIASKNDGTAYFNGFYYLATDEETVSATFNATLDSRTDQIVDGASEIRNSVIVLGKPKSQRPLLSKSTDNYSIRGGKSIISSIVNGTKQLDKTNCSLMDGKYSKYQTLVTTQANKVFLYNFGLLTDIRTLILYLSPLTPIGTTIELQDYLERHILTHTVAAGDITNQGLIIKIDPIDAVANSLRRLYLNSNIDLSVCQIEGFTHDLPYNYIGYKKETMIVKDNITDKATNDWLSASILDIHRRNARQAGSTVLGNPYLQIGDCVTIIDVYNGMYADTDLWVNGINSTESTNTYETKLSLSSVPPAQTYTKPPEIPSGVYPAGIYDWSVDVYNKSDNSLVQSYADWSANVQINSIKHYCIFNFALPVKRKIGLKVRYPKNLTGARNEIYAWPVEESIIEPGVYKRENGLKWDCGVNFEERFGSLVDKIYLYPSYSKTNYVYNSIFDIYFRQGQFNWLASPDGTPMNLRTPSYYEIEATMRKIDLVNLTSSVGSSDLENTYSGKLYNSGYLVDSYEIQWGDVDPAVGHVGDLLNVPVSLIVNGTPELINDKVYLDCCALNDKGTDVNNLRSDGATSTVPRWITTPALVQQFNWDYTDSQGQFIPSGKYQLQIKNAFLINGEVVDVTKTNGRNLVTNGNLAIKESNTTTPKILWPSTAIESRNLFGTNSGIVLNGWTPVTKPIYVDILQSNTQLVTAWVDGFGMNRVRPAEQIVRLDYESIPTSGALDNKEYLNISLTKDCKTYPGKRISPGQYSIFDTSCVVDTTTGKPYAPNTPFLMYTNDSIAIKGSTQYCVASHFKSTESVNLFRPHIAVMAKNLAGTWRVALDVAVSYTPGTSWGQYSGVFTTAADDKMIYPVIYLKGFDEAVYANDTYTRPNLPSFGIDCVSVSQGATPAVVFDRDDANNARTTRTFGFN